MAPPSTVSAVSTMTRARYIVERRTAAVLTCNPNESRHYRIRIPAQVPRSPTDIVIGDVLKRLVIGDVLE